MATTSITIGRSQWDVEIPTDREIELLKAHLPKITAVFSKYAPDGQTAIGKIVQEDFPVYATALGLAKKMIENAVSFNGAYPTTGFGIQAIRPDYMVPSAQGRTFKKDVTGLTEDEWYGLWHNGAIGDSYNATPLYLRKELEVVISGLLDISASPIVDEVQFEVNGDTKAVMPVEQQFNGSDLRLYKFAEPMIIPPAITYRSRFKTNAASGTVNLLPVGVAFVKSEFMKNPTPTQPSTTAP